MEKTKVLGKRTCPYCQTTVGPRRRRKAKKETLDAVLAGFIAAMDPFQALGGGAS